MKYFDYQVKNSMSDVWCLFTSLCGLSEEKILNSSCNTISYSHSVDIINAAINGNISPENFSLEGYESKCSQNDKINSLNRVEKELFIVDTTSDDDEEKVGFGNISSKKLISKNDALEVMLQDETFENSLMQLLNIRDRYITEKGIDVVYTVLNALKGIPDAIFEIKNIIKEDSEFSDVFVNLLENAGAGNESLVERLSMAMAV